MRLALVIPPLEGASPLTAFWKRLLPELQARIDVECFVEAGREAEGRTSVAELYPRRFDQILYVVDDRAECGFMARAIRAIGGTVDLFSWELSALARSAFPELEAAGSKAFLRALREGGLGEALEWRKRAGEPTFNRSIVRHGDAFIVRESDLADRILEARNENTPIGTLRHPELAPGFGGDRAALRSRFGVADASRVLCSLNPLGRRRRKLLLDALALAHAEDPDARLLYVPGRAAVAQRNGLLSIDAADAYDALCASDVLVHLADEGEDGTGEVFEALVVGRAVITNSEAEPEAPATCVTRVPRGDGDALAEALKNPPIPIEEEALAYATEARRWEHTAELYVRYLDSFPAPRAARRSLIAAKLRAAEARRAEADQSATR